MLFRTCRGLLYALAAAHLFMVGAARLSAAEQPRSAKSNEYSIAWAPTGTTPWHVTVSGVSATTLDELRRAQWPESRWHEVLNVRVEQGNLFADVGAPSMSGTYSVEQGAIRFTPAFPPTPGLAYRAIFHPKKLQARGATVRPVSAVFRVPPRSVSATTFVREIYPTASVLPENLLKFYVHFSAPMSRGNIYEHIHLLDATGKPVELPFLEIDEELWNPTMTRLTLFIDPGRIKRGVTPLEEVGPALEEGKQFILSIGKEWPDAAGAPLQADFRKNFSVGPPDRKPVDVEVWKVQPPSAGTTNALSLVFPEPLDHALAQRMIVVVDASHQNIAGRCELANQERLWKFIPQNPWRPGPHAVLVQKAIEDLAGNNIGKAFEVDVFDKVEQRFTNTTVRLSFEVR